MSSSQTPNYGLHQWAGADQFRRADFNEDNAAVDAALHGLRGDVDAKADQAALDALTTKVNAKAEQTALSALSAAVSRKGNCRIATGSYTGTGTCGELNPKKLTFDGRPLLVAVGGRSISVIMVRGSSEGNADNSNPPTVTWGDNSVSWYGDSEGYHLNISGVTYHYIAFMLSE